MNMSFCYRRVFFSSLVSLLCLGIGLFVDTKPVQAGGGTSNAQQMNYRFRADLDPLNSAPSGWLALENNQATDLSKGTVYRLRFTASQEGTAILRNIDSQFQYGTNADCATGMQDVPVTATTEHFQMALSGNFANGDATTTNLLQAEETTFQNGKGFESTNPSNNDFGLDVDVYTEYEYAFTITANATNGGTYYLRMSDEFNGITECASLTVETPAGITVSGNVYSNETPTYYNCNSDNLTIGVSIDGQAADTGTCNATNGTYSVTTTVQPSAGSEVVVYVDGAELNYSGTTVTLAADSSSAISGLHLYQNRVAVTYESGSSITNTNLANGDNGNTGIRYAVTGTDLSVNTGMELHVWTGKTYDPGGQVDTVSGDLHVDDGATAYIDTAGSVIAGDIVVDGGSSTTTLQFQQNAQVDGGAITTLDGGGTNATISYSGTPTVTVTGTGNIGGGTSPSITFYGLTIGTATAASTTIASSLSVEGPLDVDTSDSMSINASQTVTNTYGTNATIDGNITGSGTLRFTDASGGPGAGAGTLSAITRFDASAGNIASTTFDGRTYSNRVEIFSDDTAGAARTVTMANSTYTLSGSSSHLYIINNSNSYTLTLVGTNNPTVAIGGDLDFTGTGSSSESLSTGTGTWTVSGNVNLTDGTATFTSGNTLVMSGSGTLTSNGQTMQNLTLSGTISLAAATHTVNGNLNMAGGAVTATGSTVTMTGTSNSIVGGDNTLVALTIDPSSAGTITLQTSNLTVSGTMTVASGDTLSIDAVSLTHTDTNDVAGTGTISGTGTLIFPSGSGGPGTTLTTVSSAVRFDASGGNIASTTFDARIYGGRVEIFSDNTAGAAREVAMANSTYTLSGASSHLYLINNSDTYTLTLDGALNPTVAVGGDFDFTGTGASSEAITTGTGTWTVTGNVNFTDGSATFTSGNTFQMDGSGKALTHNNLTFQNFSVVGGSTTMNDKLTVAGNFTIANGATLNQAGSSDILLTGDVLLIESGGAFNDSGSTGKVIMDGLSDNQTFEDANPDGSKQDMGHVQIGQSPGTTKLKSDMVATDLTILNGDSLETHGWEVDLVDFIDCQAGGTLDVEDNLPSNEGNGTIITAGGNLTFSGTCTYTTDGSSRIEPDGTADQLFTTGARAFDDIYINNGAAVDADDDVIISGTLDVNDLLTVNDGELDLTTNDPATDVEGNVSITAGAELNASNSGSFNAAGSWDNNGAFTSNSGTVTFDSSAGIETVEAGSSSFGTVVFNQAAGDWTIQTDNMTTTGDLTVTAATAFAVDSVVLEVQGNFTLTVTGANTDWTGSTLYLNGSGGMYDINSKTHGGDTFITLRIGASEDIAVWDSSATTYTIDPGGCLFSEDHGTTAGRLNIYGTCNSRSNEYWSYAKDFGDGAAVTRQADVRFDDGASLTVDNGDSLEILGQNAGANRSLVTRLAADTYSLTISGTINAQYYDFDYLDASGLNIASTATVTELADGSFDNAGAASASYITVTNITSTDEFRNCVFDDNSDGADGNVTYNVNADGGDIVWKFLMWSGNKGGELYDNEANGATVDWNENLSFTISDNVMDLGVINLLNVGSDNHNLTVTTNATNGYTCSVVENDELRSGAEFINDVIDGTVEAGTEEYGISCAGADCQLASDTALSAVPLTVASNAGRVSGSATIMTYEAAADSTTVGTTFSHIVTYTCSGDF